MEQKTQLLRQALKSRFEAQRDEAKATLAVYLGNSVGIGEHPQVVEEMAKQLENLSNAEDCLSNLKNLSI